jgi:transglutaminase superfamily protein
MRSRLLEWWIVGARRAWRALRRLIAPAWRRHRPAVFVWLDRGFVDVRASLRTEGIEHARARLPDPPYAARWLTLVVAARLSMQRATCLERSLILQRWLMANGEPHDVLIGVRSPRETTIAHAWLDHEDARCHHVLMRIPPEATSSAG